MLPLLDRPPTVRPIDDRTVVDDVSRRSFVSAAALSVMFAAGCGRDDAPPAEARTRTYAGPHGPVELPQDPKRVVTMYPTDTDIALVLDLPLVAAPGARGSAKQPFAAYHAAELDGVQRITASFEPDFEAIAAARPDLIIDSVLSPGDKAGYDKLSKIAPVLAVEPKDWRDYLDVAGRALGRTDAGAVNLSSFAAAAKDARAALAPRWQGKVFASVFVLPDQLVVADAGAQVHQVLEKELGMTLHPLVVREGERTTLSFENLAQLDADVLIVPLNPGETSLERDRTALDALSAQSLWRSLPAVRDQQVFTFSGELVYTSPLTAAALLEELRTALEA